MSSARSATELPRPQSGPPLPDAAFVDVVAVVLCWRDRIGLFKRSESVAHDKGRWHCLTGYLDQATDPESPRKQAQLELEEEVGLSGDDLQALVAGPILHLHGDGRVWRVHTFRAITSKRRLTLNWEHSEYRWTRSSTIPRFDGHVAWLPDVIEAVSPQGDRRM